MKTNLFTKSLMTIAISAMMAGCSQEDVLNNNQELAQGQKLKIVVNDLGFTNEDPASRVSEDLENYITKFENGDAIGIYVIGENSVILKNVKAEKNETGWSVNGLYHYEDADYIAYFPYDEALTTADIKSETDIVTYFDTKFTENQTSEASYYACDLMMAKVEAKDVKESITFNFSHMRSMLEFVIPTYTYKVSDEENAYTYSAPLGLTLTIGENDYCPRSMGNGTYRCIVKPTAENATISFSGRFTDAMLNKPVSFDKSGITLAANGCISYNVSYEGYDSDYTSTRLIAVGDYYYSDGSICPKEFATIPTAGCIGVIFSTTTNSETAKDGKTTCSHGYVLSLYNATGNSGDNLGAWDYKLWQTNPADLSDLGLTETAYTTNGAVNETLMSDKKGLEYTGIIMNSIVAVNDSKNYYLKQALESYGAVGNSTEQFAAPEFSSGWFVPSVGQYMDLIINLGGDTDFDGTNQNNGAYEKIDAALQKVGATVDTGKYIFWSSNTSLDGENMKGYVLELKSGKCQIWTAGPSSAYRIRPILAF